MRNLQAWLCVGALLLLAGCSQEPERTEGTTQKDSIKIGELNSYTKLPAFTIPYRKGWQLALEEVNSAGGVLGREIEVISRDDGGEPSSAIRFAEELIRKERVPILMGTYFSNVGLAVSDYCNSSKTPFLAAEPLTDALTWQRGNRYTFRLRPSTFLQASMLAEQAAKLPARRWATIAPNYEYGQSAVAAFKQELSARRPDVVWVGEQWPVLFQIDAGPTVQALLRANPDAIFNVTFGSDLGKLVREGNLRDLFDNRSVVSLLTGEPEYLDPLSAEAPEGWIVTGYPWSEIDTAEHKKFVDQYRTRFNDYPRLGSLVGYIALHSVAAAIQRAGSVEPEKIADSLQGLSIDTPLGGIEYRSLDHQATMGAYVGKTAVKNGKGVMIEWFYADSRSYFPSDNIVRKLRSGE